MLFRSDGQFFQLRSDGKVLPVTDDLKAPFASVHFFQKDQTFFLSRVNDFNRFKSVISEQLPDPSKIYGIKAKVACTYIKYRSPKPQVEPYPHLGVVINSQAEFEKEEISGTLVGYYAPKAMKDVLVSGFHLHFISDNLEQGGHVLDLIVKEAEIQLDEVSQVNIQLLDVNSSDQDQVEAQTFF
mgnify:CR=1 FL=1